jgi:hypothetical protein
MLAAIALAHIGHPAEPGVGERTSFAAHLIRKEEMPTSGS